MRYNYCFLVVLVLILGQGRYACAQRVYATLQTSFPATQGGNTEVKDQNLPITFPELGDHSEVRAKGILETAYQTLSFSQPIAKNTPVTVRLKRHSDVGVLGYTYVEPMLGSVVQSPAISGNTLVNLFGGTDEKEVTLTPSSSYDGIRIRLSTGLASFDARMDIFYAFYLAPPEVAEPVTVCEGDPAELTVTNVQSGYTYKWYTTASGGTPFVSSSTGTCITPPVSTATIFYVEAVENTGGGISARVPLEVQVSPKPLLAAIPDQFLCSGQMLNLDTLNPIDKNGSSSGTYQWSLVAGGPPLKFTTINPSPGTSTYWVRYTFNNCMDYQSVTVKTSAPPTPLTITISNN